MNIFSSVVGAIRGGSQAPSNSAAPAAGPGGTRLPGAIQVIVGPGVTPAQLTQVGGAATLAGPVPVNPKSTDRPKAENQPANEFEAKVFGFFPDGTFHKGRFNSGRRPVITKELFLAVKKRAGELFTKDQLRQLKDLDANWAHLVDQRGECTFRSVRTRLQTEASAQREALRAGQDLTVMSSREHLEDSFAASRTEIRILMAEISDATAALIKPACERLRAAAQDLTIEMFEAERGQHQAYGIGFYCPSQIVLALAYFAIEVSMAPVRDHCAGRPGIWPSAPLWCDEPLWPATPDRHAIAEQQQRDAWRADNKRLLEKAREVRADTHLGTPTGKDRKALLEKINAQHDAIREQSSTRSK